jgi:hypothetical protein
MYPWEFYQQLSSQLYYRVSCIVQKKKKRLTKLDTSTPVEVILIQLRVKYPFASMLYHCVYVKNIVTLSVTVWTNEETANYCILERGAMYFGR